MIVNNNAVLPAGIIREIMFILWQMRQRLAGMRKSSPAWYPQVRMLYHQLNEENDNILSTIMKADFLPHLATRNPRKIAYSERSSLNSFSTNEKLIQMYVFVYFLTNCPSLTYIQTTVDDLTAANLSVSIAANPSTHAVPNLAGVSRPQKALSPSHQPPLQTSPTREIAVEKVEEIQVRELLAERADSDQALMSILQDMVAGQASRDDIRTYQRHNDEIRTLLESQEYNSASSRRKKHIGRWEANETHDHPGFEATITGYALQKQAENQRHAHSPQARSYGDSAASDDSLVTSTILQPKKSAIERNHWGPPISIVLLTSNH